MLELLETVCCALELLELVSYLAVGHALCAVSA